jgi:arsenical resistance protein ArsH
LVAKAYEEFDKAGRMRPSAYYDRVVDVMEELMKFTLLTRGISGYLTSRYSEPKEAQRPRRKSMFAQCETAAHESPRALSPSE